ncbi:GntR family carbon starvation induced transcriptional regulator [Nitrobacteraceae bacterium AZCC 2146]
MREVRDSYQTEDQRESRRQQKQQPPKRQSPLREALSRLTSLGLVTAEGQRGFHVAKVSAADLIDVMKTMVWIEGTALQSAIAQGDRDWEANILAAGHRLGMAPQGQSAARFFEDTWERNHQAFHGSLVAACGAPRLLSYRALLYDYVDRYRRLSAHDELGNRDVDGEHEALMNAVIRREAALAVSLMQAHLLDTTRVLLRSDPATADRVEMLMHQMEKEIDAGRSVGSAEISSAYRGKYPV